MAAGDLTEFGRAGRTLFSLGLVRGSEGNLSVWDGTSLRITRSGCELAALGEDDVLEGPIDEPPEGASSDLALHVAMYGEHGPGAIAHAHPPGSVPEGWTEGDPHGTYAHAPTLTEAVGRLVEHERGRG